MNVGYAILAMGELSAAENNARRHTNGVAQANAGVAQANSDLVDRWHAHHEKFVFNVKGQMHGMRSALHGRKMTEDELIAALKAENASHPLASREAVEAAYNNELVKALRNPEVIRKTYPDGVLPDGVVSKDNLVVGAI